MTLALRPVGRRASGLTQIKARHTLLRHAGTTSHKR